MKSISRRQILWGGGAAAVAAAAGGTALAQALTEADKKALRWEGLDLPQEAIDGPWRNLRAVKEKKVIDIHCHPLTTCEQGPDYESTGKLHAQGNYCDHSDYLVASMDRHGIAYAVVNPAWISYEKILSTAFRKHGSRYFLSAGFPTEDMERRSRYSGKTPEEVAAIIRKMIKEDGAVLIGETAGGSMLNWEPKDVKPIADVAMEFDMPVQIHTGWTPTGTGVNYGSPYNVSADWAKKMGNVMSYYPKVKFIMAHAGGQFDHIDGWEAIRLLYNFDNAWIDTAKSSAMIITAAVNGRGADRVLFGSDWNRPDPKTYGPIQYRGAYQQWYNLNAVARADISEDQRDWVLYKSVRQLLRLPEKPAPHKY